MENKYIEVKGARVNNLKDVDLKLPLNQFTVITGVSGSGKSSLAFDTLYAEGQRRYVESLSAYARQFLGRMAKPECDYILGLPPAIAIEQKVNTRNPRSTVGTSTEIYDYLRMLFARVGRTYSPVSGREVEKHTIDSIVKNVLSHPEGTRVAVLTYITVPEGRTFAEQLEQYRKAGYSRVEKDGQFLDFSEIDVTDGGNTSDYRLLVDRLSVSGEKDEVSRLTDSIETAYYEGRDRCIIKVWTDGGVSEEEYSKQFTADGMTFREPNDLMFNFNNPYGACPECEGFGQVLGISETLVVPDPTLSVYQDAVQCWRGDKMGEWKKKLVRLASKSKFPIHTPYADLTQEQKDYLWHGGEGWEGIDGFFSWVDDNQYKIQYRVLKARYRGKTLCPACRGSRLRPDVEYVKVSGRSISELVRMPVKDLRRWFDGIELTDGERAIASRLMSEITSRLRFLDEVGLGYLTLDRMSSTLSGGESQRINLATSLGSSLVGSLYILDEPSIGLHSRDTQRLISVLRRLQEVGNTVVVVEHDEEIMLAADHIVDVGRDAGRLGGTIVYEGNLKEALSSPPVSGKSYTLDYLRGDRKIEYPALRRPWKKSIEVVGANANNLKDIDVRFPLGVMTVVTGVSGSGKSTLVREILYKSLAMHIGEGQGVPGAHRALKGDIKDVQAIEFVDQNPIGTSTRSNAATYLKAFDEIRKLFADQQLSKQMGYTPTYFSFNSEGGRCEECKGEGVKTIPMQFMADIEVECEVCHGKRYKEEVLDVKYRGKSIFDVLDMTVNQAIEFFGETDGAQERKILKRLQPLQDVGLGYIKLGQSSSTLSGGESQRIKLAHFILQEGTGHTVFIFDEPTTGLHMHDIATLLKSINRLVDKGHTVIIIEHNLDVIKSADWVIDIGPEGGEAGGQVVAEGTPESVAQCRESHTAEFLRPKLLEMKTSK